VWPAYFLSALGLGTVIGGLLPDRPMNARWAAYPLGVLAISVIVFACGFSLWVSLAAAVIAGVTGLMAGVSAQALLVHEAGPEHVTQVMGLWAVAWAGTKPFASLADGIIASNLGLRWAAIILGAPAILIALFEMWPETRPKRMLKDFIRKYNKERGYVPAASPTSGFVSTLHH
jgi:MFS family permease